MNTAILGLDALFFVAAHGARGEPFVSPLRQRAGSLIILDDCMYVCLGITRGTTSAHARRVDRT